MRAGSYAFHTTMGVADAEMVGETIYDVADCHEHFLDRFVDGKVQYLNPECDRDDVPGPVDVSPGPVDVKPDGKRDGPVFVAPESKRTESQTGQTGDPQTGQTGQTVPRELQSTVTYQYPVVTASVLLALAAVVSRSAV